jgi:hypothetical protein
MGFNATFDDAVCEFAVEYDQNLRDYRSFAEAIRESNPGCVRG